MSVRRALIVTALMMMAAFAIYIGVVRSLSHDDAACIGYGVAATIAMVVASEVARERS